MVFAHKTQEKCADILLERQGQIRLAQIVLSTIATAGFVSVVVGAGTISTTLGAAMSTILLALDCVARDATTGHTFSLNKAAMGQTAPNKTVSR